MGKVTGVKVMDCFFPYSDILRILPLDSSPDQAALFNHREQPSLCQAHVRFWRQTSGRLCQGLPGAHSTGESQAGAPAHQV